MALHPTNAFGCCGVESVMPIGWWQLVYGKEANVMAN
jgi:hypothetical protein